MTSATSEARAAERRALLPFTVIIIFYSCLLGNVKRFYKKIGISDGHHKSNIRNIAKMIILVLVTTIACWLPLV